jgi:hypothetical protein
MEDDTMKKFVLSFLVLIMFVGLVFSADNPRIPRDLDNGVFAENLDYVGVNYKLISHSTTQTAIQTVPSILYGVVFGTAAVTGSYVTFFDSTTATTAGEMFAVYLDTNAVSSAVNSARIVIFGKPIQTTKGIYATNSAATFKSTVLDRKLR